MNGWFRRALYFPPHFRILLACCLLMTASAALSQETKKTAIDAGFYDLQRAHSDRSIIIFGQQVEFRKYYLVRMLDRYFTMQSKLPGGQEYRLEDDGTSKTIIIY